MVWFVMVWFVMVWFFVFMADEVLLLYMRPTNMSRGIQEVFLYCPIFFGFFIILGGTIVRQIVACRCETFAVCYCGWGLRDGPPIVGQVLGFRYWIPD